MLTALQRENANKENEVLQETDESALMSGTLMRCSKFRTGIHVAS